MDAKHMNTYTRGGWLFVECALCGRRYNAGRGGNGAGIRWCKALRLVGETYRTGEPRGGLRFRRCGAVPKSGRGVINGGVS